MARKDATSKLTLKVTTGVGADGKTIYKNRMIGGVTTTLADADALAIGRGLAGLQKHGLSQVLRTDTAVLDD